jgi:phosphoglycolate phosphatase
MKVFFDLDGTLIDSRKRLHSLFVRLTGHEMEFAAYWETKRNYRSNGWILEQAGFSADAVSQFQQSWMAQIESWDNLLLDVLYPGVDEALHEVGKCAELYVLTARQSPELLCQQLEYLAILKHFSQVLSTAQKTSKADLVCQRGILVATEDFIVGDTGEDILAGKQLRVQSIAVTCGFRNRKALSHHGPDWLVADARAAAELITQSPRKTKPR